MSYAVVCCSPVTMYDVAVSCCVMGITPVTTTDGGAATPVPLMMSPAGGVVLPSAPAATTM